MTAVTDMTEQATTPAGDPIMTAKFLVPAVKAPVVPRPRLFESLTAAVRGPLTLVSAPAGSGKTVLVSTWVTSGDAPGPIVWISLEEEDQQPGVFWSYLLAGLRRADVEIGKVGPSDRVDVVKHAELVRLAAVLCERSTPVVLVLDNAEALTRQQVLDDLDFLVRHAAGRLRLVLVTRVDPNLSLPQYRLEGSVAEIRFAELAFTPDEARQLLDGRKPELSDAALAAFSHRTRGWAAGLRLVDVDDGREGLVDDPADFTGTDIAVYFRSEVLDAQPARVRDLLLSTSVVDVLYPDLSIALSGSREAAPTLRELAQASVFLDPVPGATEAYAYHPLVRDLLRAQLRLEAPSRVRRLHRKAARWLAEAGRTAEALQQSAAADDWEAAAELFVEDRAVGRMLIATSPGIGDVFARMPAATPGPAAALAAAATDVVRGDLDSADKQLRRADELVARGSRTDDGLPLALAATATARAALAGEADEALAGAALVQDLLADVASTPAPDMVALALFGAGRGRLVHGELGSARELFTAAVGPDAPDLAERFRRHVLAQLALVEAVDGRLDAAVQTASEALSVPGPTATGAAATAAEIPHGYLGVAAAHVALVWVAVERGDLMTARHHVQAAWADDKGLRDPVCAAVLTLVRSRQMRLEGDVGGAVRILAHWRDRRGGRTPPWLTRRMEAVEALALLADGRAEAAESRVRQFAAPETPDCLLAHGWVKLAAGDAAESWRTARQVARQSTIPVEFLVEANLLGAAGALALSRPDAAAAGVDEARRLASAEGLQRPFEEAPARLRTLLAQRDHHRAPETAPGSPAASPQLVPGPRRTGGPPARIVAAGAAHGGSREDDVIVQPLTEREHEVLTYLDQLLPTEEIAARMFVSVNTVKTHVRAVLRKLAAERRNEAVRRARELGLV
jgi:LuxR family maltose regulon positive regulatory protein